MQTNEAERQFYLAMAGVHLWYAREPLPGAAPSPEFAFPQAAIAEPAHRPQAANSSSPDGLSHKTRPSRQADPAAAARIADLQALMKDAKAQAPVLSEENSKPVVAAPVDTLSALEPVAEATKKPGPVVANISAMDDDPGSFATPDDALKVTLALWQGRKVSLVAALSTDASTKLQQTLAQNILRSLGETAPQERGPVHWPVFNNLLVPGNQPQDLTGVLTSLFAQFSGQKVIVLGVSDEAVENNKEGTTAIEAVLPSWLSSALPPNKHAALSFRFSLAELAAQPRYKRELWSAVKTWGI